LITADGDQDLLPLRIDDLGADGDGVVRSGQAPIHVRYALPGERVLARLSERGRAAAEQVLDASLQRVLPPCRHFGTCGGCVLQHLELGALLDWKVGLVSTALSRAGFVLPETLQRHACAPNTRRRADLAIRRGRDGIVIGLHVRGSEDVVALTECHVLARPVFDLLDPLRIVLARLQGLRRAGSLLVNLLDSGPDLLLATDAPLEARDRTFLAEFAAAHGVPRISWRLDGTSGASETVCMLRPATHRFGQALVQPPPGAFMQATVDGEAAIVDAVLAALPKKLTRSSRVVELYAGCGTLSFPLSERARVEAYEGQKEAAACLAGGAGGRRLEVRQRDLNRQPLQARELAGAAVVVLDPPHAGAGAQARDLAASGVPNIVYVSCNPSSLSADAALLAGAGYRLERLTVIDQFLWSARVESVSLFTKPASIRRGPLPRPPR